MNATAPFRPAGSLEIGAALGPFTGPWNPRLAAHLLRRAGFGGSPAEVAKIAGLSMSAAVDGFVHFPATDALSSGLDNLPDVSAMQPAARPDGFRNRAGSAGFPPAGLDSQPAVAPDNDVLVQQRMQIAAARRRAYVQMQTWWLGRMLATRAPLQEKMTLFWHGHFASAVGGKGITPQMALAQNNLFRSYAVGNIRDLTLAVSKDPAMLRYLDNFRSERAHPNENYARELMELFTLGIGNYTEQDVRESARAFTGWTVRRGGGFFENARQHDDGRKNFLGRSGNFDGGDIVAIIFDQPAAPRWFARKLLNFFVYNDPEPELVDALAVLIKRHDFNLQPVLSTLFRSNVFYSDRAYRALVKSPTEFIVGSFKLFGLAEASMETVAPMARMGQQLFRPPSVKGWDGGASWLNTQTVLARENFASALMAARTMNASNPLMMPPSASAKDTARSLVATILQGDAAPAALTRLESYLDGSETVGGRLSGENYEERIRGAAYLTMAMPAYQLN